MDHDEERVQRLLLEWLSTGLNLLHLDIYTQGVRSSHGVGSPLYWQSESQF